MTAPARRNPEADAMLSLATLPVFQALPFGSSVAGGVILAGECLYGGVSGIVGATAVQFTLYDGSDATGPPIDYLSSPINSAFSHLMPGAGIHCSRGIYFGNTGGVAFSGVIWVCRGIPD